MQTRLKDFFERERPFFYVTSILSSFCFLYASDFHDYHELSEAFVLRLISKSFLGIIISHFGHVFC